jgi:DNA-binding response OmpR family regulator
VERDFAERHSMKSYLEDSNMQVVAVSNRNELAQQFLVQEPSLVILSFHLGREDGLGMLNDIRLRSNIPVIIIGDSGNEFDLVAGLELGADDYLRRPFGLRELLARIRAILRRAKYSQTQEPKRRRERGWVYFGPFQLDKVARRLSGENSVPIELSKREYALLMAFLDAPNRVLSRVSLMNATRVHEDVTDRSIDGLVLRLRRKLEVKPGEPRIIRTVRGIGYRFCLSVQIN